MKAKKKNKIVFVCTGNTCRSPMAAELFKREIEPLNLPELIVCSAGIQANEQGDMNEKSKLVLKENGMIAPAFHPTQISETLIQESIAIICMTESHRDYMMDFRWNVLRNLGAKRIVNNVYCFKDFVGYDIPDPYGQDLEKYRYVFQLLEVGMVSVKEKILTKQVIEKLKEKPKSSVKNTAKKSGLESKKTNPATKKTNGKTGKKTGGKTQKKEKNQSEQLSFLADIDKNETVKKTPKKKTKKNTANT